MPGNFNATGIDPSDGGPKPFPAGEYHLRITGAEAGVSKKGNDKVTVDFAVVGGTHSGREIRYHTVTFLPKDLPGAGMVLKFLKCIGEPYEGEFTWDERRWLGRVVKAIVTIEPDLKGRDWNRIFEVREPDEEFKSANQKSANEQEVPF